MAHDELIAVFDEGDRALIVLVARTDHSIWENPQQRVERLRALFKEEPALDAACLTKVVAEDILPTDLVDISLGRWHTERAVLIGDAAHGFEPFGGLGGSMALEDAYVLAAELAKMLNEGRDLSVALNQYQSLPKTRVRQARKLTRRMQCWGTIESPFLRRIVNQLAPVVPESWITKGYFEFMRHEL